MRQPISAKQGHERRGPGSEPFVKSQQRRFARHDITDQHDDKIDEIVLAEAGAGETHPILDRFQNVCMSEHLSKSSHFSHPEGH